MVRCETRVRDEGNNERERVRETRKKKYVIGLRFSGIKHLFTLQARRISIVAAGSHSHLSQDDDEDENDVPECWNFNVGGRAGAR